jgi:hypothetical protein
MPSFAEVLSKRADEIHEPPPLPPGTYAGIIDGPFQEIQSRQKGTPGAQFSIRLLSPINVQDQEQLAVCASKGHGLPRNVRYTFYVTEASEFMLKRFLLDHLGLDGEDKTMAQILAEAPGRQVAVQLRHEVTQGNDPRLIHVVEGFAKI